MKISREMNEVIFRNNLLATLNEFDYTATPKFKITPVYDPNKLPSGDDDYFRLVILGENNIGGKIFSLNDTVEVLSCCSPQVPTQIKVIYHGDKDGISLFELLTSTRIRKPSQLTNIEMGHPPIQSSYRIKKGLSHRRKKCCATVLLFQLGLV